MTKDRAKLDFTDVQGSEESFPPPEPQTIRDLSRRLGFRETANPASTPTPADSDATTNSEHAIGVPRRTRRRTGRVHQFGTRLKSETIKKIYEYADNNDITLAEVIEEAMRSLENND